MITDLTPFALFFVSILFFLAMFAFAVKKNFFKRIEKRKTKVFFIDLLVTSILFIVSISAVPYAISLWFSSYLSQAERIAASTAGGVVLASFLLTMYLFQLRKLGSEILGTLSFLDLSSAFFTYFFALAASFLLSSSVDLWIPYDRQEQLALSSLRALQGEPIPFFLMVSTIVLLVPFVEELFFRGVLQNTLLNHFSFFTSLIFSSLLFASLHMHESQGFTNIELVAHLFLFSLFLGYLYERNRSFLANYSLHAGFNGATLLFVFLDK